MADKFAQDAQVSDPHQSVRLISDPGLQHKIVTDAEGVPDSWMGLDVGPESNKLFRDTVLEAKTILWNGYVIVDEFG